MKRSIAVAFAVASVPLASGLGAQTSRPDSLSAVRAAYDTVSSLLPAGPRAVVVDDPLAIRDLEEHDAEGVAGMNRELARDLGLRAAPLSELRVCRSPGDCGFVDGVAVTVCLALISVGLDSATIRVTSSHFIESEALRQRLGIAWQAVALREVRLKRGEHGWKVVAVVLRAES